MSRDTNFYYSFLVLPAAQRDAIVVVWDFCRAVDDAVDEPEAGRPIADALEFWREELRLVMAGGEPRSSQGRALRPVIERFDLPARPFEDLIDGVAMDVGMPRYRTFADLREYCYRVASTVGLVCVRIFGCHGDAVDAYAVQLGLALQLTNILRDVPVDLAKGRLYIPQDELERFGCTEADLARGLMTDGVRRLLAFQSARAHAHYDEARRLLPRGDRRRLVAAVIMGAIYEAILRRIDARGFDVFSEVVRVPRPRRAVIAAATWLRVAATPW